ncbi:MAG: lipoprotein [Gammaproteobacteria bacterium]|nr:lipoprotein [Gammaproteobacteria bacterium]
MNHRTGFPLWLVITMIGCLPLLFACGQKGPLYLPEQEQQEEIER